MRPRYRKETTMECDELTEPSEIPQYDDDTQDDDE
jgi:hypothetical protein